MSYTFIFVIAIMVMILFRILQNEGADEMNGLTHKKDSLRYHFSYSKYRFVDRLLPLIFGPSLLP